VARWWSSDDPAVAQGWLGGGPRWLNYGIGWLDGGLGLAR
jgi:hypothetical protein